ncbi:hypothetical protein ACJJTC_019710 [Scirpophaga incertulas]
MAASCQSLTLDVVYSRSKYARIAVFGFSWLVLTRSFRFRGLEDPIEGVGVWRSSTRRAVHRPLGWGAKRQAISAVTQGPSNGPCGAYRSWDGGPSRPARPHTLSVGTGGRPPP